MGAVHKITVDFHEDTFTVIAVRSSMEIFTMVYTINLFLKSKFKRSSKDLQLSKDVFFPLYEWKDIRTESYWTLMSNVSVLEENSVKGDLFENEPVFTKHHLLPQYKEADYLLKIEHEEDALEETTVKQLLTIPKVITAYALNTNKLKHKSNLIF